MIESLRKKHGFSQIELARKVGVTQQAISAYEKGIRQPPIDVLIKLSEIFNCTIDELVKGEKENGIN